MFNKQELALLVQSLEVYEKQVDVLALLGVRAYDLSATLASLKAKAAKEAGKEDEKKEEAKA